MQNKQLLVGREAWRINYRRRT